jgi:hypothetical protein
LCFKRIAGTVFVVSRDDGNDSKIKVQYAP